MLVKFCSYTSSSGNVDLTKIFPFLGNTQLQVLSVIASLLLLGSHLVMAVVVKEKILLSSKDVTGYVDCYFFDAVFNCAIIEKQIRKHLSRS